jgi:hypothetical protein
MDRGLRFVSYGGARGARLDAPKIGVSLMNDGLVKYSP